MSDSQTPEPRTLRSTVRNPRRRPRQSDGDSMRTAPRRKRSKITEDTFIPRETHEEAEEINGTIEVGSTMNGSIHSNNGRKARGQSLESASVLDMEIPLRGGKKPSLKRPPRGDGTTVLAHNDWYTVKLLPSTPKELRSPSIEYRGSLGPAHQALAVTEQKAYIWDYTSHAPVSSPRIFDTPFSVKSTDPLPFGALVTNGNSAETGLVLVSATTGTVVYYESIDRAASLSLFQDRGGGVEGSVGSLFSGEHVAELVSANHAGFVVVLTSGRIIHLTLRDGQGKARVSAQFLRATEPAAGGIFGSIKGMLSGGSWRKDVAAVHTRSLGSRGPMQAVAVTDRAQIQLWELGWSGQNHFTGAIDFKEVIVEELRRLVSPESEGQLESIKVLDFAILEKSGTGKEIATIAAEQPLDILVLVRSGSADNRTYTLAELAIVDQDVTVGQMVELNSYQHRSGAPIDQKPRLLVPKPQRAAYVVFEDAVVLVELGEAELEGPEAQLHASYIQKATFEDAIFLKENNTCAILDEAGEDNKGSHSSAIAFVRGAGLMRVSMADISQIPRSSALPIKTKIEQAVFHGELQRDNILDFSRVGDTRYSPEDVEEAVLRLSNEVLSSAQPIVATTPTTSMEAHLAYKAQVLRALVSHVRPNYPTLSEACMWQLLWDAEKVAAAQSLWTAFETHKATNSKKKQKRAATLVDEVCALAVKETANAPDIPSTEDTVRDFFTYQLQYIHRLLKFAYELLRMVQQDSDQSAQAKMRLTVEADDLWNKALDAVFTFRIDNASFYGVLPGLLEEGILKDGVEYAELPEFWTSTESMLKAIVGICRVSREIAVAEVENNGQDPGLVDIAKQVCDANPALIQQMCLIYQERINWLASRRNEKQQEMAEALRQNFKDTRYDHFRALGGVAQTEAGIALAEKYHDMRTLTDMVVAETQFCIEALANSAPGDDATPILHRIDQMQAKVGKFFESFGDKWANTYFDEGFSSGHAGVMFREAQENWQEALTKYLRAEPSRAKLCWINDITADKDFRHAAESLAIAAKEQESMLWAKKVELSLSKLAILGTEEGLKADGLATTENDLTVEMPMAELEIVNIQSRLHEHLAAEVGTCIDHDAELQVAMQNVGLRNQDLHSLKQLLEAGLDRVLHRMALSVDELIDVLTLMECMITDDAEHNLEGQEFYLALKALNVAAPSMPQKRVDILLQLIWKRCYVYDDWIEINSSQKQLENKTLHRLNNTMAWRTLFYAIDRNLFDPNTSHVRLLMPSECLGAGCQPQDLSYRWSDSDVLHAVLHDNRIQDEQLQSFIEDRRLDQWIELCVEDAKGASEQAAEEKARDLEGEREFARSFQETGRKTNGHGKQNGIKVEEEDGVHHGVEHAIESADFDNDVATG